MNGRGHRLAPPAFCRTLLSRVELAESFTMAEWLAVRADGRTVKEAYAEAARLARGLDKRLGGPEADAPAEAPPGTQPTERERRPALVLTRELRECLGRIERHLGGATMSATVADMLLSIAALLEETAATPDLSAPDPGSSPAVAGEGGSQ